MHWNILTFNGVLVSTFLDHTQNVCLPWLPGDLKESVLRLGVAMLVVKGDRGFRLHLRSGFERPSLCLWHKDYP